LDVSRDADDSIAAPQSSQDLSVPKSRRNGFVLLMGSNTPWIRRGAMSARKVGKQAVVIGAGMAGLAAAGAVAGYFERVVVLERDRWPNQGAPRRGAPQSRHLHALLPGGERALTDLFPRFERDFAGRRLRAASSDKRDSCGDLGRRFPSRRAILAGSSIAHLVH
jgi:hypothetical protein